MTSFRRLLLLSALFVFAGSAALMPATADDATPAAPPAATTTPAPASPDQQAEAPAPSGPVDAAELMAPGPLPEIAMGDEKAPVTIVEYHSMTCPHCAHFEETVLPTLTEKYIKTGKVRLITIRGTPFAGPSASRGRRLRKPGGSSWLTCRATRRTR